MIPKFYASRITRRVQTVQAPATLTRIGAAVLRDTYAEAEADLLEMNS